jgi:hypothetical protein
MNKLTKQDKNKLLCAMREDSEFKEEVITAIVSDKSFVQQITQAVFAQPVSTCGILSNGSIAEWFLHAREKQNKRRDRKTNKTV